MKKNHALTLIELMIAMTILSMLTAICYGTLHAAFSLWEKGIASQEFFRCGQIVLSRMMDDLRCAYVPKKIKDDEQPLSSAISNKKEKIYFRGIPGTSHENQFDALHFVRVGANGTVEVGYWVEGGILKRRYNPFAYSDVTSGEREDGEFSQDLLEKIEKLTFCYWYNQQWLESWPTSDPKTQKILPQAVRIALSIKKANGEGVWHFPQVLISLPLGE
ncbi:MAG: prepilin-type N-terminal cleavage/methylation domain-containing protein [Candidatus Brocadiae bacterium]|nr:prepilin-type N-terminal cleavage/methylation domain-containing protein [Candidatus Brocadiia bacterium]